jgi:hypothetical protein
MVHEILKRLLRRSHIREKVEALRPEARKRLVTKAAGMLAKKRKKR